MSYNLFLDDVRQPNSSWMNYFREVTYDLFDFKVAKNYEEFVKIIDELGVPLFVSYDHDLAESHYDQSMFIGETEYNKAIENSVEKTGLECAKYLISKLKGEPHPLYVVHSQNPIGKIRIKNCIEDYNKSI